MKYLKIGMKTKTHGQSAPSNTHRRLTKHRVESTCYTRYSKQRVFKEISRLWLVLLEKEIEDNKKHM